MHCWMQVYRACQYQMLGNCDTLCTNAHLLWGSPAQSNKWVTQLSSLVLLQLFAAWWQSCLFLPHLVFCMLVSLWLFFQSPCAWQLVRQQVTLQLATSEVALWEHAAWWQHAVSLQSPPFWIVGWATLLCLANRTKQFLPNFLAGGVGHHWWSAWPTCQVRLEASSIKMLKYSIMLDCMAPYLQCQPITR